MRWYEIKAKADVSEVWLYDQIGKSFFGDGVSAKEFIAELNAIKSPRIDMHINSPGGEVFEGAAIYNAVKRHPATVTSFIDGIAASIASVIALAGEKVIMAANALYMLHNPSGLVIGTAGDMRKTADILDKVRDTMVGAYAEKSGKSPEDIVALLDTETWMDAEETKAAGFADEIGEKIEAAACADFLPIMAKMGFKRIPRSLTDHRVSPDAKSLERALEQAGCSASMAKAILAEGFTARQRDAGPPVEPSAPLPQRDAAQVVPARIDNAARLLREADVLIKGGCA